MGDGMTHDFDEDFDFSTSDSADALVKRACHRLIPNVCGVTRASAEEDRRGVDYWIMTPRGRLGLDLKLRRRDYRAGRGGSIDCVIELDGHGTAGWLLKAGGADLILFATQDTHRVALFRLIDLRTAVLVNLSRWLADGRAKEISTESTRDGRLWRNRAVIVNAELLAAAIDRLDGSEHASANDETWL
jgi:hypothetical protein